MAALYRNLGGTEETSFQLGDDGPSIVAKTDALGIQGGALLVPSMTATQRDALTPADGMLVYNSSADQFQRHENSAWTTFAGGGGGITSLAQDLTPELGGDLDALGRVIVNPVVRDYAVSSGAAGFSSGALTLDYSLGPDFSYELTANVTSIGFSNWPTTGLGKVSTQLRQPTSGAFTVALSGIDFGDQSVPVMTTGTGALMEMVLWSRDAGVTVYGALTFQKVGV